MGMELIFTSARKGLKAGTSGSCTVAMTEGLPGNLCGRLESMCGYRFAYPPHDPKAHLNPVNYSYLNFQVGGKEVYLLSRICSAGFDHTQRSNLLAHHVVLDAQERASPGPAWVASQPEFFRSVWNEEPQSLPPRAILPLKQPSRPASAATSWKAATGDAGWAGMLAAATLANPQMSVAILYTPQSKRDVLPLVDEALALMPAEKRWGVTFSTYLTDSLAGMNCSWRGILPDSPLLADMRRNRKAIILDLTEAGACSASMGGTPLGALDFWAASDPKAQKLIECARTGTLPNPVPSHSAAATATLLRDKPKPSSKKAMDVTLDLAPSEKEAAKKPAATVQNYSLISPPAITRIQASNQSEAVRAEPSKPIALIIGIACVVAMLIGGLIFWHMAAQNEELANEKAAEESRQRTENEQRIAEDENRRKIIAEQKLKDEKEAVERKATEEALAARRAEIAKAAAIAAADAEAQKKKAKENKPEELTTAAVKIFDSAQAALGTKHTPTEDTVTKPEPAKPIKEAPQIQYEDSPATGELSIPLKNGRSVKCPLSIKELKSLDPTILIKPQESRNLKWRIEKSGENLLTLQSSNDQNFQDLTILDFNEKEAKHILEVKALRVHASGGAIYKLVFTSTSPVGYDQEKPNVKECKIPVNVGAEEAIPNMRTLTSAIKDYSVEQTENKYRITEHSKFTPKLVIELEYDELKHSIKVVAAGSQDLIDKLADNCRHKNDIFVGSLGKPSVYLVFIPPLDAEAIKQESFMDAQAQLSSKRERYSTLVRETEAYEHLISKWEAAKQHSKELKEKNDALRVKAALTYDNLVRAQNDPKDKGGRGAASAQLEVDRIKTELTKMDQALIKAKLDEGDAERAKKVWAFDPSNAKKLSERDALKRELDKK